MTWMSYVGTEKPPESEPTDSLRFSSCSVIKFERCCKASIPLYLVPTVFRQYCLLLAGRGSVRRGS